MRAAGRYSALLLVLLVGCQQASHPASGLATLEVKVIAEPKAGAPRASPLRVYDVAVPRATGSFERVDYSSLDNIVVWLEPKGGATTRPSAPANPLTIDVATRDATMRPTSVGQRLVFRNSGTAPRTIYSVSDGNEFDLGSIPPGGSGEYAVRSPGPIEVLTDSSSDPTAILYAAPTRWMTLARSGETVSFNDVPPGNYRLVSWHPRLPGSQQNVTLGPDQAASATIKVTVNGLPEVQAR